MADHEIYELTDVALQSGVTLPRVELAMLWTWWHADISAHVAGLGVHGPDNEFIDRALDELLTG